MASPGKGPSSNGFGSPVRSDDRVLDGGQSRQLSIPSPPLSSVEFKSPDRSWDTTSGSFDSPRSSVSTSSIESPSSSNLMRSQSEKMKPRRNHSAYLDEETGTWKCRNCGGTYDVPNPGSRQRREHKKACEETQRLQAIKKAEQARREEDAREAARLAALREKGFAQESSNQNEILRGRNTDHVLQNGHGTGSKVTDDPSIMGAFNTTPDIPEIEEVNFEAPKELIHNIERDSAGYLHETQTSDAQSSRISDQDGADVDRTKRVTMEDKFQETDLPSEHDLSATDQGPGGKAGPPLKIELSGKLTPANGSTTPTSTKVRLIGSIDPQWIDKASTSPNPQASQELEQVKYCSPIRSNGARLEGTVYDRLVDLHDDPQVMVTRSASMGHERLETARIASLNHGRDIAAKGVQFTRALSMDRYGVGATAREDPTNRGVAQLDRGKEAAEREDPGSDPSPEALIEVLVGRNHSRSSSSNQGIEMEEDRSKALVNGIGDNRIGYLPRAAPSVINSRRTQLESARAVGSSREQSAGSPQAAAEASSSKESQSHNRRGAGPSSRNHTDNPKEDDNLVDIIARNLGKFWRHGAAVGAVIVIAWVGNSLTNNHQGPRGQTPRCRRGHCPYYWDDQ